MKEPRYQKLARLLVRYSMEVKKNDLVLLHLIGVPDEMGVELIRETIAVGGKPIIEVTHPLLSKEIVKYADKAHIEIIRDYELARMKKVACYCAIRGGANSYESADVPSDKQSLYSRVLRPVLDQRVNKTRWVVLRWPSPSMAQSAGMSTEAFEDFYFDVCTFDYKKMAKAIEPLKKLMHKTDTVRLVSPGTDLEFSIKGIGATPCVGERNIPDGEIYSCPVKNSVQGRISYNTPSPYQGSKFEGIVLDFKDGKIVNATSNNTKKINEIFDTDVGARYVGEFAIGFNPFIMEPMQDILFDEKIAGSIHFTPGQAYEDRDNGNRSAVHWDMVLIQRPEYGGGEIYFDNKLVRKDGLFVLPELQQLNPKELKKLVKLT